jgi:pimeloyl-ACP methyl ester carboxylesterase
MLMTWAVLATLAITHEPVAHVWAEVAPQPPRSQRVRQPDRVRAVVLIHGLLLHPISHDAVIRARLAGWQEPNSALVKALANESDVYSFGYAQNAPVEAIALSPALWLGIQRLRALGYSEIALIGYSAGGLIARHFVEEFPTAGVNKVIQVCTPNGGSNWGRLTLSVRAAQVPFLTSLTRAARTQVLAQRAHRLIPPNVEFVCVVGSVGWYGDILVASGAQWTDDLQAQGVPAFALWTDHLTVMRGWGSTGQIAALVRDWHPRWPNGRVAAGRRELLHLSGLLPNWLMR